MKAVAISAFRATPEVMDLPKPGLRPGTLLVRVSAAGMNPFDWKMIDGILDGHMPHQFPMIIGVDGAGVVEAVGEGVTRFKTGDRIYGQFIHSPIGEGAYAEYAIVPEKAAITHAPSSISLATAAAVPTSGMTALQLLEHAGLQKGQTLLIIGATGGVGSFAVQMAAAAGLKVIATAGSTTAAEHIRGLGATAVIDYKKAPVPAQIQSAYSNGIDGLIDLMSDQEGFNANSALVKEGGVAFTTAFVADDDVLKARRLKGGNFETKSTPASLDDLTALIEAGKLKVPVETTISLEDVAAALAKSRTGRARGKTVIKIADA
ncbi:NADP-dependent oxidoreductase [uncultured Chitinophaga sp.]|jgi:NADPH:quinone reductase and related Zn-dependent oxidoreductases|uniref:NADP-dependent oxidoreductase n=1 Tax=uncultured Chitinophaga sp. TaxID=339340 RepID=UPI00260C4420|nr:NADP-dependent oxidoreductase [uncultured Chitinophaga sp.]